jgi:KDO2-lipid IV(A) lauroyltransferase
MRSRIRKASHLLQYWLVRLLQLVARVLPRPLALRAGALFGGLLYHLRLRRRVVRKNLEYVGIWNRQEARRITRRLYRNTGRYLADFLRAKTSNLPHDFRDMPMIHRHLARGKGIICVLAHFGNWEALATIFAPALPTLHVVAKPMHNPYVEHWLQGMRDRTGARTIEKDKALRGTLRALQSNEVIAILIDQNARGQGEMVPFLGKPASTVRTVAGLLHRTDCSLLLAHALLRRDNTYHVVVEEGRELGVDRGDQEAFIAAYQRDHNEVLSRWIRENPDHWFGWFHRRFGREARY